MRPTLTEQQLHNMVRIQHFFLLGGLFMGSALSAQPVLTHATNAPTPGPSFTRNYSPGADPGASGANVTWDFSELAIDSTETVQLVIPASTPFGNQFDAATVAEVNNSGALYFASSASGVQRVGEAFDGTPLAYTDLGLYLPFPCAFGTTWTDEEAANYVVEGMTVERTTAITGEADGHGTLLLPGGVSAEVLRVHWQSSTLEDAGVFSFTIVVDSYLYYAVGTSYPLVQTVSSTVDFMGSAETFEFVQWMGDLATTVSTEQGPTDRAVLMPNPALGSTQVQLPEGFMRDVYITLSDATGRVVRQYFLMDDGDGRTNMDLAGLTTGQYFVILENERGQRTTSRLNVL